jgi:hypothetical protein
LIILSLINLAILIRANNLVRHPSESISDGSANDSLQS